MVFQVCNSLTSFAACAIDPLSGLRATTTSPVESDAESQQVSADAVLTIVLLTRTLSPASTALKKASRVVTFGPAWHGVVLDRAGHCNLPIGRTRHLLLAGPARGCLTPQQRPA